MGIYCSYLQQTDQKSCASTSCLKKGSQKANLPVKLGTPTQIPYHSHVKQTKQQDG